MQLLILFLLSVLMLVLLVALFIAKGNAYKEDITGLIERYNDLESSVHIDEIK